MKSFLRSLGVCVALCGFIVRVHGAAATVQQLQSGTLSLTISNLQTMGYLKLSGATDIVTIASHTLKLNGTALQSVLGTNSNLSISNLTVGGVLSIGTNTITSDGGSPSSPLWNNAAWPGGGSSPWTDFATYIAPSAATNALTILTNGSQIIYRQTAGQLRLDTRSGSTSDPFFTEKVEILDKNDSDPSWSLAIQTTGTNATSRIYWSIEPNFNGDYLDWYSNGVLALELAPGVADGASSVGYTLNAPNLADPGAKLLSLGTTSEKAYVDVAGRVGATNFLTVPLVVAYASSITVNFAGAGDLATILTGSTTLTASNQSNGVGVVYSWFNGAATNCNVVLPSTWAIQSGAVTNILAPLKSATLSMKYYAYITNTVALWASE